MFLLGESIICMKFLYICIVPFLVFGCTMRDSDVVIHPDESMAQIVNVPNLEDSACLRYSAFVSKTEYVVLEQVNDYQLSSITKLEIAKDNSLIVFDSFKKLLLRFDEKGKFLNSIGEHGHGSGEFVDPSDISYNPATDQIYVIDNENSHVLVYDIDGKLCSSKSVYCKFGSIGCINTGEFCIYTPYTSGHLSSRIGYNLSIYNDSSMLIAQSDQFTPAALKVFCTSPLTFDRNNDNGNVIYHAPSSDCIYEISRDSFILRYQIVYKDPNWCCGNADQRRAISDKADCVDCADVMYSDRYLFFSVRIKPHLYSVVYDNIHRTLHAGLGMWNDVEPYGYAAIFIKCYKNKLYGYLDADFIEKRIESGDPIHIPGLQPNLNYNPVIQICTLKE